MSIPDLTPPYTLWPTVRSDNYRLNEPTMDAISADVAADVADPSSAIGGALSATVAADAANPETALNSAIVDIAESVSPPGVPYTFQVTDVNTPRPVPPVIQPGQKVRWQYVSPSMLPVPVNMAPGDEAEWVEIEPLPWSPADIPGIIGYWDAALLAVADGAPVPTWENRAGSYPDAVLIAGGTAPVFDADGLNGHPGVVFAGLGTLLSAGYLSLLAPWTLYVYARMGSTANAHLISSVNSGTSEAWRIQRNASNSFQAGYIASGPSVLGGAADTLPHLFKMTANAGVVTFGLDHTSTPASSTGSASTSIAKISLGGKYSAANPLTGAIGFVAVVHGTVTPEDEALVLDWIDAHYGTAFGV